MWVLGWYNYGVQPAEKVAASRKRMRVAQSRAGRRPMRVETMLRKEKDGSLFKDTKLAHVLMYACLDEFLKISQGGSIGQMVNDSDGYLSGVELPPGSRKSKGQYPSAPTLPQHDPPAPPEDTEPPQVFDGMNKIQAAGAPEKTVSRKEVEGAMSRLRKLERSAPTRGELERNAIAGAVVMPAVTTASSLVAGNQPVQQALNARKLGLKGAAPTLGKALKKGFRGSGRVAAGAALSGAVLGAGLPLIRGKLHREAEKEKLREYLGVSKRGKLRKKVKKELGV